MWEGGNFLPQFRLRCQYDKYQDKKEGMRQILPPSHTHNFQRNGSENLEHSTGIRESREKRVLS